MVYYCHHATNHEKDVILTTTDVPLTTVATPLTTTDTPLTWQGHH